MLHLLSPVSVMLKRAVLPMSRLVIPTFCVRVLLLVLAIPLLSMFSAPVSRPFVTATVTRVSAVSGVRAHGAPLSGVGVGLDLQMQPSAPAASGRIRSVSFGSAALGRTMHYWIYLPPNYRATQERYAVLYMLHGLNSSDQQWKDMGLFEQADALIRDRQIAPLIIVTPQGDNGYWMNHADNGPRWADYVTDDLIPHIDRSYRTLPDARHRAIGGLSMGGHGAIQLALHHPELFSVVGGHSPVFRSATEAFPFFGVGQDYIEHDPVSLVERGTPVSFALWIDMGREDDWLPRTHLFHELLVERGVPHIWHLNDGGHTSDYWQPRIPGYLAWYDQALRSGGKLTP